MDKTIDDPATTRSKHEEEEDVRKKKVSTSKRSKPEDGTDVKINDDAPVKKPRTVPTPPVQQQGEAKSPHVFYPSRLVMFNNSWLLTHIPEATRTLIPPRSFSRRIQSSRGKAEASSSISRTSMTMVSSRS